MNNTISGLEIDRRNYDVWCNFPKYLHSEETNEVQELVAFEILIIISTDAWQQDNVALNIWSFSSVHVVWKFSCCFQHP